MKLQLALDDITLAGALELLQKVHEFIDIVELQTLFCKQEIGLTMGLSIEMCETVIEKKIL